MTSKMHVCVIDHHRTLWLVLSLVCRKRSSRYCMKKLNDSQTTANNKVQYIQEVTKANRICKGIISYIQEDFIRVDTVLNRITP